MRGVAPRQAVCSCCCLANSTISTAFFAGQAGQHHEADLREEVVVHAPQH